MFGEFDTDEMRFVALYVGVVVDNVDPEKLGRVRVEIPGLVEPKSAWAFPIGGAGGGGSKQRGGYDVPDKNASVAVLFHHGDLDHPYYFGGWHGKGEQLTPVAAVSAADAIKIKAFETSRFLIVLDHRGGNESLLLKDKMTGDLLNITPTQTKLKSGSKVTVEAPQIELGGDGLGGVPLVNGVVLGSGIDPFTGQTYGALGSASSAVTAKK
jgi:hypothetical protein